MPIQGAAGAIAAASHAVRSPAMAWVATMRIPVSPAMVAMTSQGWPRNGRASASARRCRSTPSQSRAPARMAMAAEESYTRLFEAWKPRWGGDHRSILAIGRQALATRAFSTGIPEYLLRAIMDGQR